MWHVDLRELGLNRLMAVELSTPSLGRWAFAAIALLALGFPDSLIAAPPAASAPATPPVAALPAATTLPAAAVPPAAATGIPHAGSLRPERLNDADIARLSRAASAYPVSAKILRYAERLVKQYDTNGDGYLQTEEWEKMHGNPKIIDTDRDGIITVDQLARYIARYGRAHRLQLMLAPTPPPVEASAEPPLFQPAAAKGALQSSPTAVLPDSMKLDENEEDPDAADADADPSAAAPATPTLPRLGLKGGRLVPRKFFVSPRSLPPGVPQWFLLRDADGDGQVSMAEFAPTPSPADLLEFARYDTNHDGVITAEEALGLNKPARVATATAPVVAPVATGKIPRLPVVRSAGPLVRPPVPVKKKVPGVAP